MRLFLYNNDFEMEGTFGVLHGYRLSIDPCHHKPELIKSSNGGAAYGRIVEVDEMDLDMMDTFYCLGLDAYTRIEVKVCIQQGEYLKCFTYKINEETLAL